MAAADSGEDGPAGLAAWALQKATGVKARKVAAETTGLSNQVFRADAGKDSFIVRLSDTPAKIDVYERERDVIGRVRALGLPVVEVVAVGLAKERPFMISRRAPGEPALHHPKRLEILGELGRLTARVHTVRTSGYGHGFGWPDDGVDGRRTWQQWLGEDYGVDGRIETLRQNELISAAQAASFAATHARITDWDELPILNHGDLRLKNTLVNEAGEIQALIDWEDSVSSIGPHWDFSVALHDLSIDAKEAFLHGYGLAEKVVREASPVWRMFNVLNYAPTVVGFMENKDRAAVDRLRTRLSGALELYASS